MIRVEATLSDNRKSVTISRSEGKIEKSSGDSMKIDTSKMMMAKVRLNESRISRTKGGIGMTMTVMTTITPRATANSCGLSNIAFNRFVCAMFQFVVAQAFQPAPS